MAQTIALDVLGDIRIAKPCPMRWEQLSPVEGARERVRHCGACGLNVHNIAELSAEEASELILRHAASGERLCGALYRRADGTVMTKNCPVGLAAVRRRVKAWCSLAAAAALTAASGVLLRVARAGEEWHPLAQTIAPVRTASEWLEEKGSKLLNLRPNPSGMLLGDFGPPRTPPNVPASAQPLFWHESFKDISGERVRYFLAGVCAPLSAIFVVGVAGATEFMTGFAINWVVYACAVLGLPVGAAWAVAALVQLVRPRRVFAARTPARVKMAALGVLTGVVTVGLVVIADAVGVHVRWTRWQTGGPSRLMFLSRANDGVLFACAAGVSTVGVLLPLARARGGVGRCEACGYDLAGLKAKRCPECGEAVVTRVTRGASEG